MAPWSCWSEWATGTNGMGTALEAPGPVLISGPEHWCVGFHEWVCAGVAVRDAVTHEPVAVLDVSTWRANLPAQAAGVAVQGGGRRARDPAPACPRQRRRAGRGLHPDARALGTGRSPPWTRAARSSSPTRAPASSSASPRGCRRWTPRSAGSRAWTSGASPVTRIKQAHLDHDWVGSTQIVTELSGEPCRITLRPVFLADQPIGDARGLRLRARRRDRARAARAGAGPAAAHRGRERREHGPAAPARGPVRGGGRQRRLARHRRRTPPGRGSRHRQARGGARRRRVPARPPALPRQPLAASAPSSAGRGASCR